MKILPDYLIEFMPEIEEAIEELRLSVLDHAYDLLKCLDIDELSSDDIRHKLELYNISVDNMSKEWLPNGRFYRIYPSIKHNRARQNALKAIAKSGGQFEGLWSDDFSNKTEYNYNSIQVKRHYELESPEDGYFYVSGDTDLNTDGTAGSSTIKAMSSDILISQAMPAGYTYLYVPWPRPHYPTDSGYFYNVHMLMYDRLYYVRNCNDYPYTDNEECWVVGSFSDNTATLLSTANNRGNLYVNYIISNNAPINFDVMPSYTGVVYECENTGNQYTGARITSVNSIATGARESAFICSVDSVKYYYVCDSIHSEWVSDLSSIGYSISDSNNVANQTESLPTVLAIKCKLNKLDRFNNSSGKIDLYDLNGSSIKYDNSYIYNVKFDNYVSYIYKYCNEDLYYNLSTCKYGISAKDCKYVFEDLVDYIKNRDNNEPLPIKPFDNAKIFTYDTHSPYSSYYNWQDGEYTPYKAPYQFDYHFTHDSRIKASEHDTGETPTDSIGRKIHKCGSWPIIEKGDYYYTDSFGDHETTDVLKATRYKLNEGCSELGNSHAVFPTNCYMRISTRSSAPNMQQDFEPSDNFVIVNFDQNDKCSVIAALDACFGGGKYTVDNLPILIEIDPLNDAQSELKNYLLENIHSIIIKSEYTIDEKYNLASNNIYNITGDDKYLPTALDKQLYGTYNSAHRFDLLCKSATRLNYFINNIKEFIPMWNASSPIFGMMQSAYYTNLNPDNNTKSNYSLYYWMKFSQENNGPSLELFDTSDVSDQDEKTRLDGINSIVESVLKDNKPSISEITYNSYNIPTTTHLVPNRILFTLPKTTTVEYDGQGDNKTLDTLVIKHNPLYLPDSNSCDSFNPELEYTILTVNYLNNNRDLVTIDNDVDYIENALEQNNISKSRSLIEQNDQEQVIPMYITGDPSDNGIYINFNRASDYNYNVLGYVTYKTSDIHTLWFSRNKENVLVEEDDFKLYNNQGNDIFFVYSENNKSFNYTVLGLYAYDSISRSFVRVISDNDQVIECKCSSEDRRYYTVSKKILKNGNAVDVSYALAKLTVADGSVEDVGPLQPPITDTIFAADSNGYYLYGASENIIFENLGEQIVSDYDSIIIIERQINGTFIIVNSNGSVISELSEDIISEDLGELQISDTDSFIIVEDEPEPQPVALHSYYIIDNTTGEVLHSISSPLLNVKPSIVTIGGNVEHIDNHPTTNGNIIRY